MQQLVGLHEESKNPDWLELAELYRELGDMQSATRALANISTTSEKELHFVVKKLIFLKERSLARFNYPFELNECGGSSIGL
jgi:hypothetical protein